MGDAEHTGLLLEFTGKDSLKEMAILQWPLAWKNSHEQRSLMGGSLSSCKELDLRQSDNRIIGAQHLDGSINSLLTLGTIWHYLSKLNVCKSLYDPAAYFWNFIL